MSEVFKPTPENLAECQRLLSELQERTEHLQRLASGESSALEAALGGQVKLEGLLQVTGTVLDVVRSVRETVTMLESPRLDDPWFEAEFYGEATSTTYQHLPSIEGAQGLLLWCPCGYGKPEYPLDGPRPHRVQIPFANPRNAPPCPPDHGPGAGLRRPRWVVTGSGVGDLTLTPSVNVGKPSCWHGFITQGRVTLG